MNNWPNFTESELTCSCCGENNPNIEFGELMDKVQDLRTHLGFPFKVTSAYRCPDHPIEAKKDKHGQHTVAAIDIAVYHEQAHKLLTAAMEMGFTGIGINQKGSYNQRFIHLDMRDSTPTVWSY